uniref:Zinc finger PHD-type domain-containing protein n=1 Tax=Anopheles funestus TaxID=62324 RepID=A0A182S035_ANOFN
MPKSSFDCAGCTRENAVADMVQFDECDKCWHFYCAGVSSDVKDVKWVCERCASSAKDETAKVKSHDPSREPSKASRDGESSKPCSKKTLRAILPQLAKESVSVKVIVSNVMRSVDGHSEIRSLNRAWVSVGVCEMKVGNLSKMTRFVPLISMKRTFRCFIHHLREAKHK